MNQLSCFRVRLRVDGELRTPVIAAADEADAIRRSTTMGSDLSSAPLPWSSKWPNGRYARSSRQEKPPIVIVESALLVHPAGTHRCDGRR